MRKAKVLLINGSILTISALFMRFVGLAFNVYLSNRLGAETIGVFTLVMSVYLFFVTIATSGISMAVTCIVPEELEKNNKEKAFQSFKTSISLSLALGIISGILIIVFSDFIISVCLNNLVSKKILFYIAIGLPFIAISSCINGYFSAIRKAYKTAFVQSFELIFKIIVTIILLPNSISKGVESICISLILADVIAEIASFTAIYICYLYEKRKFFSSRSGYRNLKKIAKLSVPVALTSYIRSALSTIKQLIIPSRLEKSGLSSSMSFASYGIIQGMVMPILVFPNIFITSFSNLLIPEFSRYHATRTKNLSIICDKIFKLTAVFSICISSIFLVFSNELSLAIYQNLESAKWIKILAPLVFFMYMDTVIDGVLKGMQKQVFVMAGNITDLIVTIILLYFLLPILGIWGFIVSIIVSELLNFTISFLQLWKLTRFKIDFKNYLLKPIFSGLCSYFLLYVFSLINTNSILGLILSIVLFCCFYFLIYVLLNLKFRELFNSRGHFSIYTTLKKLFIE